MASGHVNRIYRPNTWLHRPMLQNVKKALANSEPSTHGTKRTYRSPHRMSAFGERGCVDRDRRRKTKGPSRKTALVLLLDDLDDAPRARFNQNGAAIHHRVAMVAYTVLRRHIVIGDAFLREDRPNPYIFAILIRRASLFDDVGTEARTPTY